MRRRSGLPLVLLLGAACSGGEAGVTSASGTTAVDDTTLTTSGSSSTGPQSSSDGTTTTGESEGTSSSTGSTTTTSSSTTAHTTGGPTSGGQTTGDACRQGSSDGCCDEDGMCCPCIGYNCADWWSDETAAYQACVCQAEVCAEACDGSCQDGGFQISCKLCQFGASGTACAEEFAACGGQTYPKCPPKNCESCGVCSLANECFDAWFACWQDPICFQLIYSCAIACTSPECEAKCEAMFPEAAALHQEYMKCVYCGTCSELCEDNGVECGP